MGCYQIWLNQVINRIYINVRIRTVNVTETNIIFIEKMIQTVDLKKEYKVGDVVHVALSNINIHINAGEFVSFYGPSGSGKSSLAKIIGFLEKSTAGQYYFNGELVSDRTDKELVKLRRENIGYVFSDSKLIEDMTLYGNLELPLLYLKIKKKERKELVAKMLSEFKLYHKINKYPKDLTVMQRQLISVGRAAITNPKVIIADEPTGHLNSSDGEELLNILNSLNEKGITLLMFTHADSIANLGRRIIRVFDGHVVSEKVMR